MRMKAGSLKPPFTMDLLESGLPLDGLDGGGATVTMVGVQGITEVFRDEDPTIDTALATCTHVWVGPVDDVPGETDAPGRIFVTAEVDLGDGKLIVFPPYGELAVDIE